MRVACETERLLIPTDGVVLEGSLFLPADPRAVVVAAGAGAGRAPALAPPERRAFGRLGIATLVVDLLLPGEAGDPRCVLDVSLLARRLAATADAVAERCKAPRLPIGYLGDGTLAAGALAASIDDARIAAVACRRGRPDLAQGILDRVTAATLLLVDDADEVGLAINATALAALRCPKRLLRLAGLGRLPRAAAAARAVADELARWFAGNLGGLGATQPDAPRGLAGVRPRRRRRTAA